MPEATTEVSKAPAVGGGAGRWFAKNGWPAWVAVGAICVFVGVVFHGLSSGQDLSGVAWLFGGYAVFGAILFALHWFFTSTKVGKSIATAGEVVSNFVVSAAVLLGIGFAIVWLLGLFFGAMPWWAALIILLLLFKR